MNQNRIVIWGAGKIGRGYVAFLFHRSGWHIDLVAKTEELADHLNQAGRYRVYRGKDTARQEVGTIDGYQAVWANDEQAVARVICAADLMAVSAYPRSFDVIAQQLAPALLQRQAERPRDPLNILMCVNLIEAVPLFRDAVRRAMPVEAQAYLEDRIGSVQVLVLCGVVDPSADVLRDEPLALVSGGNDDMPVDGEAFMGRLPPVEGMRALKNIRGENARKLYSGNMAHASLAYLGAQRGYALIEECVKDSALLELVFSALDEASCGLQREFAFDIEEMRAWDADLRQRMSASTPGDTVARVAADPLRKLSRGDRLVGPALLAWRHGRTPTSLVRVIAAGLMYRNLDDPGTVRMKQTFASLGIDGAVRDICGLGDDEAGLIDLISERCRQI